ncbi:MAG: aryl-sulfate sulfotransferase [Alphaproteobacteria bacterium]|nr:aryl-sulfate sulfotransferase [Alphaproteobacteria bacterium]
MLLLVLLACRAANPPDILDVDVVTDAGTPGVATVSFTTSDDAVATVTVDGRSTPPDDGGTDHVVEVRGLVLGRSTTLELSAVGEHGTGTFEQPLDVGSARADLPTIERTVWDQARSCGDGYLLTSLLTLGGSSFVVVLDREGRPVWARPGDQGEWLSRARPSADGSGLVWLHNDPGRSDDLGRITRVAWSGEVLSETRAWQAHHDFVERPEGGFAFLSYILAPGTDVDGVTRDVATDAILEVDEGGAEGDERQVFSMLEDYTGGLFDPGVTTAEAGFVPGYWEFSHGNSLMIDPDGGTYHVMFRWLDALIEVDRNSGSQVWQLGGERSDFTGPAGEDFSHAHMSEWWDGGFVVFDNADETGGISGAAEYAVDDEARTWDRIWDVRDPEGHLELLLGDVIRVPGCENRMVAWSTSSRVEEVTPEGEVVWSLSAPPGWIVSRISWLPSLYP